MRIFLISILFLVLNICYAQSTLPVDERGKYISYEVVEVTGTSKDVLVNRAQYFFTQSQKKLLKLKSATDSVFNAEGKFVISRSIAILSHPAGEVLYRFVAEIKEGKYRYWLTDFRFIPYQRDRYGNFVPVSTVSTPLENSPGKLNAAEWKDYIEVTAAHAKKLGTDFREQMITPLQVKPEEKKAKSISTSNW